MMEGQFNLIGQQRSGSNHSSPEQETFSEDSDDCTHLGRLFPGASPKRPSPEPTDKSSKKPKLPKTKKRRDPNEPQKPVSAYALFFRDTQAAIKGQNPSATFGEVSKIVASMWDTLDVEHKNVYKKKSESAKKDYLKALAAYRATLVSQQPAMMMSQHQDTGMIEMHHGLQNEMDFPSNSAPSHDMLYSNNNMHHVMSDQQIGQHSQQHSQPMISPQPVMSPPPPQTSQPIPSPPAQYNQPIVSPANNQPMMSPSHNSHGSMSPQQQNNNQPGASPPRVSPPVVEQKVSVTSEVSPQSMTPSPPLHQAGQVTNNSVQSGQAVVTQQQQPEVTPAVTDTPQTGSTGQPVQNNSGGRQVTCLRSGCFNPAVESPDWDAEYCSNECVVSHCGDVFMSWVASRQNKGNATPVK